MEHQGHRARLRERFLVSGLEGFAPHEALEMILTFAIPRQDVNPLAHRLLVAFGSLPAVLEASPADLMAVRGIGENAAALLSLLLPLFRLYQRSLTQKQDKPLDQAQIESLCQALLLGETVERFDVVALDARGRLISHARVATGDDGETAVYPRLIAQALLRVNAAACVLAHNHPSGIAKPSRADIELTREISLILGPLNIGLRDHVIVGGNETFSFTKNDLLPKK